MKKIYLILILILVFLAGTNAQNRIGVRAGLNLVNEFISLDNQRAKTHIATSFHLSGYYDLFISRNFSIQPGISIEGKGGVSKIEGNTFTDKLIYFELPINFIARAPTRSGDLFIGAGPYFSYGIDARVSSGRKSVVLEWGNGYDQLNPIDAGLGILMGYRFKNGFTARLSNSGGLVNISNKRQAKYLNRVSSIGVGYEFGQ
ncbi:porin family protein [Sphingobacterium sp. HJSM2_6]|uniref:porin family protein n=1 Tax=Sphingobacterium sp. HJSM2_6 TaxID=3366264 RepID=UPI003BE94E79